MDTQVLTNIHNYVKEKLEPITKKYSNDNKYLHSERVAEIVFKLIENTENLNVVAMLHDILEKTDTTREQLLELGLSEELVSIIEELTNSKERINTYGRTLYMAAKFNLMSEHALIVKLADRLDNIINVVKLRETQQYEENKKDIEHKISRYILETQFIMNHLQESIELIEKEIDKEPDSDITRIKCGILTLYSHLNDFTDNAVF